MFFQDIKISQYKMLFDIFLGRQKTLTVLQGDGRGLAAEFGEFAGHNFHQKCVRKICLIHLDESEL